MTQAGPPIGLAAVTVSDPATGQTLSWTLPDEDGRLLLVGLAPGEYTNPYVLSRRTTSWGWARTY